jgi:acylphosphatase
MLTQAHLLIFGEVQGVGFRYWTLNKARELGLKGWVKNLPDSRVEAVFTGNLANVEQMIQACYSGPTGARVTKVEVDWIEPENRETFQILR